MKKKIIKKIIKTIKTGNMLGIQSRKKGSGLRPIVPAVGQEDNYSTDVS